MFFKKSESRICVFCKLPHRVYTKNEVSAFDIFLIILVTGLMAYAIWGGPDLRSLLILMGLSFITQIFFRVRYRGSVKCPHCGFDPILYKQNPEAAASRVKTHMDQRKNNPEYMLKPPPQIKPIIRKKEDWSIEDLQIEEASTPPQSQLEDNNLL